MAGKTSSSAVENFPRLTTIYILVIGILSGLVAFAVFYFCYRKCLRRMGFGHIRRGEKDFGGDDEEKIGLEQLQPDTKVEISTLRSAGDSQQQIVKTGGFHQRKQQQSDELQKLSPAARGVERDLSQYNMYVKGRDSSFPAPGTPNAQSVGVKSSSPHFYFGSTVISIEKDQTKVVMEGSSSSSTSLENNGCAQPPSPRSLLSSGGTLSRAGSHGSSRSAKARRSPNHHQTHRTHRRSEGGSLRDSRAPAAARGPSQLAVNDPSGPRRSVSLRTHSPRHRLLSNNPGEEELFRGSSQRHQPGASLRSQYNRDGSLNPPGLWVGSENSVNNIIRDYPSAGDHLRKFPSPTPSTHSVATADKLAEIDWWQRQQQQHTMKIHQQQQQRQLQQQQQQLMAVSKSRYPDTDRSRKSSIDQEFQTCRSSNNNNSDVFLDQQQQQAQQQNNGNNPALSPETCTSPNQTQQIKYRALWELRSRIANLEEQDWVSPLSSTNSSGVNIPGNPNFQIQPSEISSSSNNPKITFTEAQRKSPDPLSSHTTSFESNTEAILTEETKHIGSSPAARRQSFKNVFHSRVAGRGRGDENIEDRINISSFDSIETQDSTSTDASRLEAITTSIESTETDSADNIPFFHKAKSQQFRHGGSGTGGVIIATKVIDKSADDGKGGGRSALRFFPKRTPNLKAFNLAKQQQQQTLENQAHTTKIFKKRPLNRFDRHSIGSLDESTREFHEENIPPAHQSDQQQSILGKAKNSVLHRYFRSPRSSSAYYTRDYSIDEKSDKLFREFSRCDPEYEPFTNRPVAASSSRTASTSGIGTTISPISRRQSSNIPNIHQSQQSTSSNVPDPSAPFQRSHSSKASTPQQQQQQQQQSSSASSPFRQRIDDFEISSPDIDEDFPPVYASALSTTTYSAGPSRSSQNND